jgi:hypothetical protein
MSRRPTFRQTDLTKALKAAANAGMVVARAEIDQHGKIVVVFGDGRSPLESAPLDEWMAKHARSA